MRSQVTKQKGVILEIKITNPDDLEELIKLFKYHNTDIKLFRIQKQLEDARKEFV